MHKGHLLILWKIQFGDLWYLTALEKKGIRNVEASIVVRNRMVYNTELFNLSGFWIILLCLKYNTAYFNGLCKIEVSEVSLNTSEHESYLRSVSPYNPTVSLHIKDFQK